MKWIGLVLLVGALAWANDWSLTSQDPTVQLTAKREAFREAVEKLDAMKRKAFEGCDGKAYGAESGCKLGSAIAQHSTLPGVQAECREARQELDVAIREWNAAQLTPEAKLPFEVKNRATGEFMTCDI